MASDTRPVIASSNRFADIEPYCAALSKEAPKRWGGIMPWNFPQNAPQDVEEAFLREQFPAVEIQVQGFRFLKQVWYCIAKNNFENRIPYMKNAWFEQNGPAYINDPTFKNHHLLHPDACAGTFFEARDIDLYGTDFLDVAVKVIQYEIRHLQNSEISSGTPAASVANTADEVTLKKESPLTVVPELHAPRGTASQDQAQSRSPKEITPMSTTSTTVLKPTATEFSSNNTPVQSMAVLEPILQPRSFSGEASSMPVRVPNNRARGPNGKRNSFHDRTSFQSPQGFHDSRFPSGQAYQQPRQQMQGLPLPQFATQGPNTWALPFDPGQPAPPRAYHNAQAPPGFESHLPPHFSANSPNTFTSNRPPHPYGPPQITERPYNHGDARNFSSQSGNGGYDQGPERSNIKRRESNASYGGKGGSVRGRGRGRGGRNSHSSIDENFFGGRRLSGTTSGPLAVGKLFDDHQYDTAKGRNSNKHGSWNLSKRDENTAPYSRTSDQFIHGPTQILHNPRRASYTQAVPGIMQRPLNAPSFGAAGQYPNGLVLPDGRDKFSGERGGLPLPDYGCQKNVIGPLCTYAKKLVIFGIPEPVPAAEIYELFAKYGPIHNIDGPVTTEGTKGMYSRTYITFNDAEGARKCIAEPPAYLHEWRLGVEVAQEFWDQTHHKFRPRSDFGWSAHDLTNVAPPSMHYVQTSTINPAPPTQAHRHEHSVLRPSETFSKEGVSAHTTPTVSGPGTPKGKKKKNNKNKKPKKENIDQAFAENAQKTRPALSPIPDDSSSVAETVVTRHATPVKRADSLRPESVVSTQPAQGTIVGKTDDVVDKVSVADASALKSTASETEAKQVTSSSADLVAEETVDAQSKSEDEPIDDSFHTASATPSEELPTSIDAKIEPAPAAVVEDQVQKVSLPNLVSTSKDTSSDTSLEGADVSSQIEAAVASSSKAAKKTNVPVLPKTRVSIALPQLDTSKASTVPSANPEHVDEAPLTATQERTISGNSDRPSAPFVTAPNTPSSPLLAAIGGGEVQSRKEAKAKEEAKAKGPAQTPSLSLFSKPKKGKRKGTGPVKGRDISLAQLELPEDFPVPVRRPTGGSKSATPIEQPKVTSKSGERVETAEPLPNVATAIQPVEDSTNLAPSNKPDTVSDVAKTDTAAKVEATAVPSILRLISNKFIGASQHTADGKDEPQAEGLSPSDVVVNQHEATDSFAADEASTVVNAAATSKKSKKKKKPKKSNDDQAKAEVLTMSHVVPSNEPSIPLCHSEGTEAGSTASGSTVSQELKQTDSSSLEKVKTPRRLGPDNHLVQASPPRRVVSRPKPIAKKSSDSSDSPKKATPSSGTEEAQQVPRTLAEISEICAKSDDKIWYVFVRPDSIEAAKMRMQSMDEQEKDIKEKKKLAMEGGRVLGEVVGEAEDEVEDDGVRVAEVVESME